MNSTLKKNGPNKCINTVSFCPWQLRLITQPENGHTPLHPTGNNDGMANFCFTFFHFFSRCPVFPSKSAKFCFPIIGPAIARD